MHCSIVEIQCRSCLANWKWNGYPLTFWMLYKKKFHMNCREYKIYNILLIPGEPIDMRPIYRMILMSMLKSGIKLRNVEERLIVESVSLCVVHSILVPKIQKIGKCVLIDEFQQNYHQVLFSNTPT